jgi:hypothetical protein
MKIFLTTVLAMVAAMVISSGAARADLVVNGGFETGSILPGWTQSGNTAFTFVYTNNPHGGLYSYQVGPAGSLGYLSQTLATESGHTYHLSYWLNHPTGSTPNEFYVSWDGSMIAGSHLVNAGNFGATEYSFDVVASGASTPLTLAYRDDQQYYYIDDISVTPEPATLSLLAAGGLAALWRRRRK